MATLSVCMIVKNEQKYLHDALKCIKPIADEIIVVDTGSTDATKEIASFFGAKIYDFPWIDDFSAARNESLKHATCDYIMWIDADDRIAPEEVEKLRQLKERDDKTAKNLILTLPSAGDMHTQLWQLRWFPNNKNFKFTRAVHEEIITSIKAEGITIECYPAAIVHIGYNSLEGTKEKGQRNLDIFFKKMPEWETNILNIFYVAKTYCSFGEFDKALVEFKKAWDLTNTDAGTLPDAKVLVAMGMAETYKLIDDADNVEKWCLEAIKADPLTVSPYFYIALKYDKDGNETIAMKYYQKCTMFETYIKSYPSNDYSFQILAYSRIIEIEKHNKNLDKAIAWCKKGIKANPNVVKFYSQAGWILVNLERYEEALVFLNKSLELKWDGYPETLLAMAKICNYTGDHDRRKMFIEECFKYFPDSEDAFTLAGQYKYILVPEESNG